MKKKKTEIKNKKADKAINKDRMNIVIGKYIISNDNRCMSLTKIEKSKSKESGEAIEVRKNIGFYSNLPQLFNGLLRDGIVSSKAKSLEELAEEIKDIKKIIKESYNILLSRFDKFDK